MRQRPRSWRRPAHAARFLLLLAAPGLAVPRPAAAQTELEMRVEFIADRYFDTPQGDGLLPTALTEARIAAEYAQLAEADSTNVAGMRRYAGYVLHAVEPTMAGSGPGLGYGVRAATRGVLREIAMVASADSLSDNVRIRAGHVLAAAENVLTWSDEVLALTSQIATTSSVAETTVLVERLVRVTDAMVRGVDGNGDGRRGWPDGDEGLEHATWHMTLLKRGEGLGG